MNTSLTSNLSADTMKFLWLVGACERLGTLQLFDANVPFTISQDAIDVFLEIDEKRNEIFEDDLEVAVMFSAMAIEESEEEISESDLSDMIDLVLEYKNNRDDLIRYALSAT